MSQNYDLQAILAREQQLFKVEQGQPEKFWYLSLATARTGFKFISRQVTQDGVKKIRIWRVE